MPVAVMPVAVMPVAVEDIASREEHKESIGVKMSSEKVKASKPAKAHRIAEEDAMEAVELGWGLAIRYYPVSERFAESMSLEGAGQAVDITDKFSIIDFPTGASVIYLPEIQKLVVKNTPKNLSKMEDLLSAFGETGTSSSEGQVEIEARFVEFTEGALEELGFNWSSPDAFDLPGDWDLPADQDLFSGALRSVPFSKTGDLGLEEIPETGNWRANRLEDMFGDDAGTLSLSGQIDSNPIDLLIRALDQTSGVDVLSAPSITTLSGKKATIKVGERHNYPMEYEEGVSVGTVLHVRYVDWKEKILGVEMDVTPTIKGNEIDLEINPKITDLIGWEQFQLASADTSYTYYQYRIGQQFEHERVVAKLPVFKRREIKTEISVSSGSTVAMGGLISEKLEAFEDRVPVLGSIPLIGRLFRSEGERTVKRNLMIFVTARKVSPSGRIISERSFE